MSLLSILQKYKPEDALQMEKEKYKSDLSLEEKILLKEAEKKDTPSPEPESNMFDSLDKFKR